MWNVSGLEAVARDYGPRGVKFFFVYKALAHPELAGGYVQPFSLEERLAQARQGSKQLGSSIPWIVDAIDNRLKHALGDRPNSEFVIDPQGRVARKRAWSNPEEVRKDLEQLVGPVERVTKESEVRLKLQPPPKPAAATGVVPRLRRERMQPLVMRPHVDPRAAPFYAKLRAEADEGLVAGGKGKLYLGFHLDPLHGAHWNNLTRPLHYRLEGEGVKIKAASGEGPKGKAAADADPREFLVEVESWPEDRPLRLTVRYFACTGQECHAVEQTYTLHRRRDKDGGGARGEGAGYWDPDEFAKRTLAADRDGDGRLSKAETANLVRPQFDKLDANKDGFLDEAELRQVGDWLNTHHQPGTPAPGGKRGKK